MGPVSAMSTRSSAVHCPRRDAAARMTSTFRCTHAAACNQRLPSGNASFPSWRGAPRLHVRQHASRLAVRAAAAADTLTYGSEWTTPKDSYVVLGLAHCFERAEDGKLSDVFVIEPVSANSLECMVAGAKTCFKALVGVTLGDALARDKNLLPDDFANAAFCADYEFRCDATARTWLRPHAQDNLLDIVPLRATKTNFNFSLDDKRVLNMENIVDDSDNIKQDMSIDVYGRKEEQAESLSNSNGAAEPPAAVKADDEDDDGLDDLFAD